jgi:transcriptional regulator with XRE-family HTH domain
MGEATLQSKLGQVIRDRRIAKGFSQESFADAIEMHRTYYSAIERGERNITLLTLSRVCDGLLLKPSELLRIAGS